jgi:biopolymer transport protein ExbB
MTITGGPVFWILLAMAVVAVVTWLERMVDLRRAKIDWQDFLKGVTNVLDGGGVDEALAICEDTPAPVAQIVATAIRHRSVSRIHIAFGKRRVSAAETWKMKSA